ncbi:hypothetical protein PPACK8108_LOCUS24184 [Phakopsora pachyrhizi]|uniref:Uncharacterized protein n=1 Tax=Phakopsora pachyrhizi TaxID=170000 RepID=A0AAV0BP80_PHAPC|nr:hypothetical protein PPACK8108_LOCUS24184 [Phakopsora pachyrhizi]
MEDSEKSYAGGILETCMGSPNQQGCNMNEEPEYLEETKYSVLKEFPGHNLIDEQFVIILSATFSGESYHNVGRKRRERIARGKFDQWEYFDGWVKGTGTQPGYAESTAESLVEETDWGTSKDNLMLLTPPSTPVKGVPQFCCSINSASLGEEFQEKLRIWMQESRGKERDLPNRGEAKEGRNKELKDQLEVMVDMESLEEKDLEEPMGSDQLKLKPKTEPTQRFGIKEPLSLKCFSPEIYVPSIPSSVKTEYNLLIHERDNLKQIDWSQKKKTAVDQVSGADKSFGLVIRPGIQGRKLCSEKNWCSNYI